MESGDFDLVAGHKTELQHEVQCFAEEVAILEKLCMEVSSRSSLPDSVVHEGLQELREARDFLQRGDADFLACSSGQSPHQGMLPCQTDDNGEAADLNELIQLGEEEKHNWKSSNPTGFSPFSTITPLVALYAREYAREQSLQQVPVLPTPPSLTVNTLQDALRRHGLVPSPTSGLDGTEKDVAQRQPRMDDDKAAAGEGRGWGPAKKLEFSVDRNLSACSPESPSSLSDFSPTTLLRTPDLQTRSDKFSRLDSGPSSSIPSGVKVDRDACHREYQAFVLSASRCDAAGQQMGPANVEEPAGHENVTLRYVTQLLADEQRQNEALRQHAREAVEGRAMMEAERDVYYDNMVELSAQLAVLTATMQELTQQLEEPRQSEAELPFHVSAADLATDIRVDGAGGGDGGREGAGVETEGVYMDANSAGCQIELGRDARSSDKETINEECTLAVLEKDRQQCELSSRLALSEQARTQAQERVGQLEQTVSSLQVALLDQSKLSTSSIKAQGWQVLMHLPLLVVAFLLLCQLVTVPQVSYVGLIPT